jgi:hypothetical protein
MGLAGAGWILDSRVLLVQCVGSKIKLKAVKPPLWAFATATTEWRAAILTVRAAVPRATTTSTSTMSKKDIEMEVGSILD